MKRTLTAAWLASSLMLPLFPEASTVAERRAWLGEDWSRKSSSGPYGGCQKPDAEEQELVALPHAHESATTMRGGAAPAAGPNLRARRGRTRGVECQAPGRHG